MDTATARKELSDLYPDLEKAEYFADYVEISAALGSGPASTRLIAGLKALEKAMTDFIVAKAGASDTPRELLVTRAVNSWDKRRAVYDGYNREKNQKPEKIEVLRHVLTATLEAHETEDGFQQEGAKVPVYVDIVDSAAFIQALRDRRHWKDVGAGVAHGEFTHRIQWYILSAGGVISREDKHPAKVFATLGDHSRKGPKKYLWDDLCDRLGAPEDDWRQPEKLNQWLRSPTCKAICPLLSTFLEFRYYKREPALFYRKKKLGLTEDPKKKVTILDYKNDKYQPRD